MSEQPWLLSRTGKHVDLLDPKPEQISIADIAFSLSKKCRFNGHTLDFYSVAQHCCCMFDRAQETGNKNLMVWCLLHDAAEAFLPDVHTQLKPLLLGFDALEDRFMAVLVDRFGLETCPPELKIYDLRMLATEKRDVMPADNRPWAVLKGIEPFKEKIYPWEMGVAQSEFAVRFAQLNLG